MGKTRYPEIVDALVGDLARCKPGDRIPSEHEIAATQGVYNWTATDRNGLDDRSRILLTVKNGKYVPAN